MCITLTENILTQISTNARKILMTVIRRGQYALTSLHFGNAPAK